VVQLQAGLIFFALLAKLRTSDQIQSASDKFALAKHFLENQMRKLLSRRGKGFSESKNLKYQGEYTLGRQGDVSACARMWK
jgi:hypothetical protein